MLCPYFSSPLRHLSASTCLCHHLPFVSQGPVSRAWTVCGRTDFSQATCLPSFSEESSPKSPTEADAGSSHTIKLFKDQSQGAVDQLSLILSPEHQISHKLYLPQSTATAALGAAARLAMSRSLLHWFPSVKRTEA